MFKSRFIFVNLKKYKKNTCLLLKRALTYDVSREHCIKKLKNYDKKSAKKKSDLVAIRLDAPHKYY